jgi:hypothetical protein
MNASSNVQAQDFVAQEAWPAVSVMLDGFGDPSLPASAALAGRTLDIVYDDGTTIRHDFTSPQQLTGTVIAGEGAGQTGTHTYRAVEVRPGIQIVDFLIGEGVATHDITLVVNLEDGRVTTADSSIESTPTGMRTMTRFLSGRIVGTGEIEPRRRTDALVGKRIYYRYSATERYEHIYLNCGTFVWHCIDGGERGLADVDETRTFELADDLYVFFWKEGVMPVESFLVIDLRHTRSIGRMFCWEAESLDVVHIPFDSRFTVLNETTYPND